MRRRGYFQTVDVLDLLFRLCIKMGFSIDEDIAEELETQGDIFHTSLTDFAIIDGDREYSIWVENKLPFVCLTDYGWKDWELEKNIDPSRLHEAINQVHLRTDVQMHYTPSEDKSALNLFGYQRFPLFHHVPDSYNIRLIRHTIYHFRLAHEIMESEYDCWGDASQPT